MAGSPLVESVRLMYSLKDTFDDDEQPFWVPSGRYSYYVYNVKFKAGISMRITFVCEPSTDEHYGTSAVVNSLCCGADFPIEAAWRDDDAHCPNCRKSYGIQHPIFTFDVKTGKAISGRLFKMVNELDNAEVITQWIDMSGNCDILSSRLDAEDIVKAINDASHVKHDDELAVREAFGMARGYATTFAALAEWKP